MAGLARPSDNILIGSKIESTYNFISDVDYHPYQGYGCWRRVFDGSLNSDGNDGYYACSDLIIEFLEPVNIYGISSYNLGNSVLNIYDENKNNLNSLYKKNYGNVNGSWKLMFEKVPAGIYIFNSGLSYNDFDSLISELFIESVYDEKFLLKKNNMYYTINNDQYDTITNSYINIAISDLPQQIADKGFYLRNINKDVTVNDETFKPIDKFSNFSVIRRRKL